MDSRYCQWVFRRWGVRTSRQQSSHSNFDWWRYASARWIVSLHLTHLIFMSSDLKILKGIRIPEINYLLPKSHNQDKARVCRLAECFIININRICSGYRHFRNPLFPVWSRPAYRPLLLTAVASNHVLLGPKSTQKNTAVFFVITDNIVHHIVSNDFIRSLKSNISIRSPLLDSCGLDAIKLIVVFKVMGVL